MKAKMIKTHFYIDEFSRIADNIRKVASVQRFDSIGETIDLAKIRPNILFITVMASIGSGKTQLLLNDTTAYS